MTRTLSGRKVEDSMHRGQGLHTGRPLGMCNLMALSWGALDPQETSEDILVSYGGATVIQWVESGMLNILQCKGQPPQQITVWPQRPPMLRLRNWLELSSLHNPGLGQFLSTVWLAAGSPWHRIHPEPSSLLTHGINDSLVEGASQPGLVSLPSSTPGWHPQLKPTPVENLGGVC